MGVEVTIGENKPKIPLLKVTIIDHDMVAEHDFPCPICRDELAVLQINEGVFKPCWDCQKKDWFTVNIKSSFIRWLLGIRKPN